MKKGLGWTVRRNGTVEFTPELIEKMLRRCARKCREELRSLLTSGQVLPNDTVRINYELHVKLPK